MKSVLIATKNKGKIKEFERFFSKFGYQVQSLLDYDKTMEIEETGTTFEENALIKARTLAKLTKQDVISDDSGLEVSILDGEPGIYSARYSGIDHDDEANNSKLMKKLENTPIEKRGAQFVCALAFVTKDLKETVVRGTCQGVIAFRKQGNNGFGYDPLFYIPRLDKTLAQLTPSEKEAISHRGDALKQLEKVLFGD